MNSCVRELLAIAAFGGMGFLSLWAGETREVLRLSSAGSNKANGTTTASYWVDARYIHIGYDEETAGHQSGQGLVICRQGELWWHDFLWFVEQVERTRARPRCIGM